MKFHHTEFYRNRFGNLDTVTFLQKTHQCWETNYCYWSLIWIEGDIGKWNCTPISPLLSQLYEAPLNFGR